MNFPGAFPIRSLAISVLSIFASAAGALAPAAPSASFSASTLNPAAGALVLFTDTSGGAPTSWNWDFGDGTHATEQNPGHVYTTAGPFTVRLTATHASGSASTTVDLT